MFPCKISPFAFSKFSQGKSIRKSPRLLRCFGGCQTVESASHRVSNFFRGKSNNGFHGPGTSIDSYAPLRIQRYNYSALSDRKCWNCQQYLERKKIYCALCGALQFPEKNVNYFELLGISQKFELDLDDLSSKFRKMQMTFHPDKFGNKSKTEMEISEMHSSLINKAYTTLKDPLKRGFYLLELKNFSVQDKFSMGQDFLISIMEKNEELENIKTEVLLNQFMESNIKEINNHINMISKNFHYNNLNEAKANLLKLNYFINLDLKIKKKQTDLMSPNEN